MDYQALLTENCTKINIKYLAQGYSHLFLKARYCQSGFCHFSLGHV